MTLPPAETVSNLISEANRLFVAPHFKKLARDDIIEKNPNDLVTIADIKTEDWLKEKLTKLLPGSAFLGEETIHREPEIWTNIKREKPPHIWVVDPIDGTGNFVKGKDMFCSMIALVVNMETIMSWIFDPVHNHVVFACKNEGVRINNQPLKPKEQKTSLPKPSSTNLVGHISCKYLPNPIKEAVSKISPEAVTRRNMHCAGQHFLSMLRGESDFFFSAGMKPWDHAPGVLLMSEAGGKASIVSGAPYLPIENASVMLAVANSSRWDEIHAVIFPGSRITKDE